MTDAGKRAAIYPRVSTDDQRGNYSIPTQLAELVRYVEAHGYALVGDRYVDRQTGRDCGPGPSAVAAFVDDYTSRLTSRPGLDAALTFAETAGYDILVVHALDRLARDPYTRQNLELEFERRGVKIEYVLGNYDDTPEGEVRKDLDATFSKWENAKRVERTLRGKIGKAKAGRWVTGRIPYGYRSDKAAPAGLAIEPTEAATVQRIFYLHNVDRLSARQITRRLNEDGIRPSRAIATGKDTPWSHTSIERILHNEAYAGIIHYNMRKYSGKKITERDRAEWIEIAITPIIDAGTFRQAQQIIAENTASRRRPPARFYLLGGLVRCSQCGKAYMAQTARARPERGAHEYQYYRHAIKAGHCSNHAVSAHFLEPAVWAALVNFLLDPDSLRQGYEESQQRQEASHIRQREILGDLRQAARGIEQKRHNLTTAYVDPEIALTKAEYLAQRKSIEQDLAGVLDEIARVEGELGPMAEPVDLKTLEAFSAEVREKLQVGDLAPEDKRLTLQMLRARVVIDPDGQARLEGDLLPQGQLDIGSRPTVQNAIRFTLPLGIVWRLDKARSPP